MIITTDKKETQKIFDDFEDMLSELILSGRAIRPFDIANIKESFDNIRTQTGITRGAIHEKANIS